MKKKAVSPLIAYILLVGMVVATSVMVASYLTKYAERISYESKEIEIYCSDVAFDAVPLCKKDMQVANFKVLELNLTNRGYFNISNLTVIREETNGQKTTDILGSESFGYYPYNEIGKYFDEDGKPLQAQIRPNQKAMLQIVIDSTKINKITITPWIEFNGKIAACNEKAFKLENTEISSKGSCTP